MCWSYLFHVAIGDSIVDWRERVHPDDREQWTIDLQRHLAGESKTYRNEHRLRCKNGNCIWVLARGKVVERAIDGTPLRIIGTHADTNQRRLAEEAAREAQLRLAEANHMLKLVLDTIPARVFWKNLDSVYMGCNRAFAQDSQLDDPADVVGKTDLEMQWRHRAVRTVQIDREVMSTGTPMANSEFSWRAVDGRHGWLRLTKVPLRDLSGAIMGILGTYNDTTVEKAALESLRVSEALNRLTIDGIEDAVFVIDRQYSIALYNTAFERWMSSQGIQGPYQGRTLLEVMPWLSAVTKQRYEEAFRTGASHAEEQAMNTLDGTLVAEIRRIPMLENGEVTRVVTLLRDMTEKRAMEQAVIDSETKLRTLFSAMTEGVAIYEPVRDSDNRTFDHRITDVNPAFTVLTGIAREDAVGRLASQVYQTRMSALLKGFVDVAAEREPRKVETFFPQSGRHLLVSVVTPNERQVASVFEDVTELRAKREELQARSAEMQRFTYAVSHNLKSPVVTVKAFLGYLRQDIQAKDNSQIQEDLDHIGQAADNMAQRLDELLELSRKGRVPSLPVYTSLHELAREALESLAGQTTATRAKIVLSSTQYEVFGDRKRLVEIYQNLIDNALKHAGDQVNPRIEIGARREDKELVFFVKDNGPGIATRNQMRVFEQFERLDAETPGWGLGLALVRRIVEAHGGRIWLESAGPGLGCTFQFTIPGSREVNDDQPATQGGNHDGEETSRHTAGGGR